MRVLIICLVLTSSATPTFAWDGIDSETGASVEIQKGNLVRPGRDIEIYDVEAGEYHTVTVESMRRFGRTVEIEVTDENGESRTLEMDSK